MSNSLTFVAHPDDDLIFFNPDVLSDIRAGHRVWVCYLTAGNLTAGPAGMDYADKRIQGARAAYAKAAGVVNDWSFEALSVGGRALATNYLKAAPQVRLVFTYMSAAAGSDDGDLARMWADPAFVAAPIDGRASYTKAQFVSMLSALTAHVNPDFVRCHDPQGQQCGDNIDHDRAGKFACTSNLDPVTNRMTRRLDSYFGYAGRTWVENVAPYWAAEKLAVWRTYKPYDPAFNSSPTGWDEMAARQYQRHIWQPGDTWTPL